MDHSKLTAQTLGDGLMRRSMGKKHTRTNTDADERSKVDPVSFALTTHTLRYD